MMQKKRKMTETLAHGYSSDSTVSMHDRVYMVFKNVCIYVLLTKVASAFEGLTKIILKHGSTFKFRSSCNSGKKVLRFTCSGKNSTKIANIGAGKIATSCKFEDNKHSIAWSRKPPFFSDKPVNIGLQCHFDS